MTPFEAARKMMNTKSKGANLKLLKEYFFVDYNLMDSFIFENYLNKPNPKQHNILELAEKSLDSMHLGNMCSEVMKKDQNYNILPDFVFLSGIKPTLLIDRTIDFP